MAMLLYTSFLLCRAIQKGAERTSESDTKKKSVFGLELFESRRIKHISANLSHISNNPVAVKHQGTLSTPQARALFLPVSSMR